MMNAPVYRYLRGFSLDPGFSTRLDTAAINEVVYQIPFEPLELGPTGEYQQLEPGPVGEYIEVTECDDPDCSEDDDDA